jgi:hypothetical protein
MQRYLYAAAVGITFTIVTLNPAHAATPAQTAIQCPIEKSIYQAIGNPTFELKFSPIQDRKIATEIVSFTVNHHRRGVIGMYNLGGSMGYGGLYLRDAAQPIDAESDRSLQPFFFDGNWRHAKEISGKSAPQYFFIAGLGAADWYSNQSDSRKQPLGDVMWQLAGCVP